MGECGTFTAVTDDFGDFWLKNLPVGVFDVTVKAEGFKSVEFKGVNTEKSVNLGDTPMEK